MEKGAMWLVALVITATVSGQNQVANSSSYLDAAITGFDPFYMTALSQPNPGRRSKLFQPLATLIVEDKTVLYSFVDEELDTNYLPKITVQKIVNFNQYLNFAASSAYELSSDSDCGEPLIRHEQYSSCKTKNHQQDSTTLQFFKDTGGEVLFAKTDIVTHTITISSFEITKFTPAFKKAIETLYKAAVNQVPQIMNSTFIEFVRLYGTHFSKRTLLGSRAIFGKLFSTRAATVEEETARRRCVLEAVRKALTPCMRGCNETTETVFTLASSGICGGEEHEPIVVVTGLLPERNLEDWASAAKHSPNPIFHELEPLSTLFTSEWFEDNFDGHEFLINGTILSQYFDRSFDDYSRRMEVGGLNSFQSRGCGLSSDCQIGTECLNEPGTDSGFSCIPRDAVPSAATSATSLTTAPAPTTPTTTTMKPTTPAESSFSGPVLMMGGYGAQSSVRTNYLSSGEAIDTWILPNLPYAAYAGTLAAVGSKIYSCGGYRDRTGLTSSCYVLDRASDGPRWNSTTALPTPMHHHTSVTVKNHIWTVYGGKLYDLNTKTNKFHTFPLPLTVTSAHCAVSNGSHSFIIGAGATRDEIWVNSEKNNPAKWHQVGHLRGDRTHFGCLLLEQEVFITGGESSRTDAVVFDSVTHTLRSAGRLVQGRHDHQMFVFEGKPAVVGGYSDTARIGSIETYDPRTAFWMASSRSLTVAREDFGLVQLHG